MSESSELLSPSPLPPFAVVHLAAAGYLARYSGRTRDAYTCIGADNGLLECAVPVRAALVP